MDVNKNDAERMFWQSVDLATANPRLYKCWEDWNRFLQETPFYELERGLVEYFGCHPEQVSAWIDWKQSKQMKDDSIVIDTKWAWAQKVTWDSRWPRRFQWLLEDGQVEPED